MEFSCSGQCHNNRGVGSCFQEELGSPVQVGPAEVCATPAFPKPCQACSEGWAEECQGSTGVSWVFLVVLHPTGLLCRTGGCPTGGCLCAEAAGFTPGVTWAVANGRTHGTFCPAFLGHCWDKQRWLASEASSCPFRLVLGGRGLRGRAGRGSTSFPGQQAELHARVGLLAIGSFRGHEEAEPACIKTLGGGDWCGFRMSGTSWWIPRSLGIDALYC